MADETDQSGNSKNVKVSGTIDARFTPEFLKEIKTGQTQEHARETNRFRVEIATLVIVLIYTTVAFWQGCSTQKAADAAKSAADTAQKSLQISESAYLFVDNPTLTLNGTPSVTLRLANSGHLAAENVTYTVFEMNLRVVDNYVLEGHWTRWTQKDVPAFVGSAGTFIKIDSPHGDGGAVGKGQQGIFVAGSVEYSDGFPDTPRETAWFCQHTIYNMYPNSVNFMSCDADEIIALIKRNIGYPASYEPVTK